MTPTPRLTAGRWTDLGGDSAPKLFRGLFSRSWKHGLARKSKPWTMEGEGFCRCLLAEQADGQLLSAGSPSFREQGSFRPGRRELQATLDPTGTGHVCGTGRFPGDGTGGAGRDNSRLGGLLLLGTGHIAAGRDAHGTGHVRRSGRSAVWRGSVSIRSTGSSHGTGHSCGNGYGHGTRHGDGHLRGTGQARGTIRGAVRRRRIEMNKLLHQKGL